MTNPISKAIVKAAVAMGYGKKSDYKGSTVAEVLEKFAAIAKDKGSSGGGWLVGELDTRTGNVLVNMPIIDIIEAINSGALGVEVETSTEEALAKSRIYFSTTVSTTGGVDSVVAFKIGQALVIYMASDNDESGNAVFQQVSS